MWLDGVGLFWELTLYISETQIPESVGMFLYGADSRSVHLDDVSGRREAWGLVRSNLGEKIAGHYSRRQPRLTKQCSKARTNLAQRGTSIMADNDKSEPPQLDILEDGNLGIS
jgi:hypothetical protein